MAIKKFVLQPKSLCMIIKRHEFDIRALAQEVMRKCPEHESSDFKHGYTSFVVCFFQDLDFCTDAFRDSCGEFDAELEVLLQITLNSQSVISANFPLKKRAGYGQGVKFACENSASLMRFAFEVHATNLAA